MSLTAQRAHQRMRLAPVKWRPRSYVISGNTVVRYTDDYATLLLHGNEIARRNRVTNVTMISFAGWPTRTTLNRLNEFCPYLHLTRLDGDQPRDYTPTYLGMPFPADAWLELHMPENTRIAGRTSAQTEDICAPLYERLIRTYPSSQFRHVLTALHAKVLGPDGNPSPLVSTQRCYEIVLREAARRGPSTRRRNNQC